MNSAELVFMKMILTPAFRLVLLIIRHLRALAINSGALFL